MFEQDSAKLILEKEQEEDLDSYGHSSLSEKEKKVLIDLIKNDRKMNSTEYHQFKEGENLPPRMKVRQKKR